MVTDTLVKVDLPLLADQVVPMAVTVQAPDGAPRGTRFRVHVTQISEGVPTGGVTLDVEAV